MGISTDGILFYGIAFGDSLDKQEIWASKGLLEDEDYDWETLYTSLKGELHPPVPWSEENRPIYVAHWERRRALLEKSPCRIGRYCSDDYSMYYVSAQAGHYKVSRGYATEIPDGLTANPSWRDQIKEYCEFMGLPFEEPRWLLVSFWG